MKIADLRQHFKVRFTEWVVGFGLFFWGLILLINNSLFIEYPNYSVLAGIAAQPTWAIAAILIATLRLVFLFINGSFRRSAHLRALGSGLSACFWGAIWTAYIEIDLLTNLASIGVLLALDLYSLWYAAEDAKLSDIINDPTQN